jgi:cytochrome o ubiquinol oxidase subunit 1
VVHSLDAWWDMKARGFQRPLSGYKPIHMPKNTATGVILGVVSGGPSQRGCRSRGCS